ncbi:unnamed protein product, partial [Symbiodinium sp. KB8]
VAALPSPPDLTPYALAADLAAAEGLVAANSSSLASLSTSVTTGLGSKANQSALDALQLDVDGKSTPASVDLKLANHPTNASMNSAITSANNATLATVAANYGLKSTQDQQALDIAARQTAADKIATALLPLVAQTALDAALALRDGRLDAAEAAIAALQGAGYQTAADVASALASHTDTAGLNALLAVRDARLDGHDADILALQGATAWPGQTTWDLLVGTNTIRNWHFQAPLSVSLENDNFTLSLASQAEVDALLAPLASESWVTVQMDAAIAAAVAGIDLSSYVPCYYTSPEVDGLIAGATLANAPVWTGNTTWELLTGQAYTTQGDIDSSISTELANYWDQGQTSAEIASQISGAGFLTEAQGDATYHPVNGNTGGNGIIPMVLDNFTPRMIRALLPQAPLGANLILGNSATVQLTCDCYSKSESDGRYFSDYAPLDARYHVVNGNAGGGGIIPM